MTFTCAVCGVPVIVIGEEMLRPCPHKEAAVYADMAATVYGQGSMDAPADGLR